MALGALIAGGASLFNAFKNRGAAKDAAEAAQFTPMGISGPSGSSSFDPATGTITQQLGGQQQGINDQLLSQSMQNLGPNALAQGFQQQGGGQVGNMFDLAQGVQQGLPGANQAFQNQSQGLFNQFTGAGQQGLGAAFGAQQASPFTQGQFTAGQALQNSNFGDVEAQVLANSRALARPGEENAAAGAMDSLFSSGRLGTTGGATQFGQLAQAQEFADIQRQQNATQFANQLQNQNFQQGNAMFQQGLQGLGLDQALAMNQGNLGAGLFSQAPGIGLNMFNAQGTADQAANNRAQQRLGNAQNLFGFGQGIQDQDISRSLGLLGASQGLGTNLNAQTQLGLQGGAQAAQAGANAGRNFQAANTSPFATALGGFASGGGFNSVGNAVSGLFGGGGNQMGADQLAAINAGVS